MRRVYGGCHAHTVMDPSDPADLSDPTGSDGAAEVPASGSDSGPPTAGGRRAWVTLGVIGLLLIATITLTVVAGTDTNNSSAAITTTTGRASAADGPCDPTIEDPLDPGPAVRLLPNAPAPEYQSNPPTSGPFEVGPRVPAVSTVELSGPVQVGLLAQGKVLIQYRDLSTAVAGALQSLASTEDVVVAPNASLTSPIIATAWRTRQECSGFNAEVLNRFVILNANRGPQASPSGTSPPTTR